MCFQWSDKQSPSNLKGTKSESIDIDILDSSFGHAEWLSAKQKQHDDLPIEPSFLQCKNECRRQSSFSCWTASMNIPSKKNTASMNKRHAVVKSKEDVFGAVEKVNCSLICPWQSLL